ncbi:hypothetical protein TNCV_3912051 [Trichonephila clavipes]|nr:hypothetical protein TNCV_3912051 [Trichonephila clavipes]
MDMVDAGVSGVFVIVSSSGIGSVSLKIGMGDKIIRTPVKEEKSFINRELDPPLTELQTVCDVGWTHRGHEQLVMEYEAILRGERSLMPKL